MSSLTPQQNKQYWANRSAGVRGQVLVAKVGNWLSQTGTSNRKLQRRKWNDPQYTKPNHGLKKDRGR